MSSTAKTQDILVVDDVKGIADILHNILQKEGYKTDVVYNGQQAIDRMAATSYRLVVTDVIMPHKDGFDVIDYISNNTPETKIIVITGGGVRVSALETLKAIGDRTHIALQKPVTKSELVQSVASLIGEAARQQETG